jgi:hypothetical protein
MKLIRIAVLCWLASGLVWISAQAQVTVSTSKNDNSRTGQNLSETILTPANVNVNSFGKLFSQTLDGYAYAQPLYVPNLTINGAAHNVVFVATEHDSVYAFDADSNTGINASPLWQTSFIDPAKGINTVSSSTVGCGDITPEIGVTSTPVIDPSNNTLFVIAKTDENGRIFHRLHALNILTGAEQPGSPVAIGAKVKGTGEGGTNGVVGFNPLREAQRPGLLLLNGNVVIGWASHCDNQPYHGWVMAYNESTLAQVGVWNSSPDGGLAGVWQSGTGLASDGTDIFLATGNGTYDGPKGGDDFGDSIVKLSPPTGNRFQVLDFFTPYNQLSLSGADEDVGSGGVLLLPDQGAGAPHEFLALEVGKEGSIYLMDRTHMGHYNSSSNQIVQDLENAIGGLWASPSWWNNNVYFGGSDDYLRLYTFDSTTGLLSPTAVSQSQTFFGFPGPTVSISANSDSDAIAWVLQTDDYGSGSATLHAFDATNLATEFYNSGMNSSRDNPGGAVKFTIPTIANGKVYVPAVDTLSVFGLLQGK